MTGSSRRRPERFLCEIELEDLEARATAILARSVWCDEVLGLELEYHKESEFASYRTRYRNAFGELCAGRIFVGSIPPAIRDTERYPELLAAFEAYLDFFDDWSDRMQRKFGYSVGMAALHREGTREMIVLPPNGRAVQRRMEWLRAEVLPELRAGAGK